MNLAPLKAIRKYCKNCGDGTAQEVRLCVIPDCPLYAFRFGRKLKRTVIPA
jgi:hypothetical protein